MWQPPNVTLQWGPYFKVEVEEEQKQIDTMAKAVDAGFATKRMALAKLRSVLKIESVDAALEAIEEESAENMQRQQERMHALGMTAEQVDTGDDTGGDDESDNDGAAPPNRIAPGRGGAAARTKPAKAPSDGSGPAPSVAKAKGGNFPPKPRPA